MQLEALSYNHNCSLPATYFILTFSDRFHLLEFRNIWFGQTAWNSPTERAGVLMGCGLTDWWTDCVASCDGDRESFVVCLGKERLWPHQVAGPMRTGGYFREDKAART